MSGGPSLLYSRIWGGGEGQRSFESGTSEWGLLAIASLEVLLIALYLGNHQCQFLFGYSDHPEKLFQSPPWRVVALLPFFLVTKWGERVGVNISGCMCSPNPSFHYSTPYPTSCAECLTQRLIFYILLSETVSSDMYPLPGWKRSNHSALWSRRLVWGTSYFLKEVQQILFILVHPFPCSILPVMPPGPFGNSVA